jgi:hypothetical protein
VKSVDTGDLKSPDSNVVPVQVRLRAPIKSMSYNTSASQRSSHFAARPFLVAVWLPFVGSSFGVFVIVPLM